MRLLKQHATKTGKYSEPWRARSLPQKCAYAVQVRLERKLFFFDYLGDSGRSWDINLPMSDFVYSCRNCVEQRFQEQYASELSIRLRNLAVDDQAFETRP
ncbi:hypothetical protein WI91_01115 [Burkholderia vietnamiensis]|nr:hypothetical protein WI91_01115 [Burkholderia vietnamiensis]